MGQTAFNQSQFDAIYPQGIERHYWNSARNQIIYRWLLQCGGESGPMLEIGCGRGIVVEYLRARGLDCFGVEAASIAPLASVGAFVKTGITHASLNATFRQSIDTILLFDVIEHIPNEVAFINSIRATFPNLKRVIVTVPARMELWSNYDEYNGHFRRYSIQTLTQLSDKLHISSPKISYFFHSLYMPARLLLLRSKLRDTHITAPHGWRILAHNLLAKFFLIDFLCMPARIPGTSLLCYFDLDFPRKD